MVGLQVLSQAHGLVSGFEQGLDVEKLMRGPVPTWKIKYELEM